MVTKRTPTLDKDGHLFDRHMPTRLSDAELKGIFPEKAASPRDTFRVKQGRKPVLAFDQMFPNVYVDHKIVWVHGDSILYGIGHDNSLRTSSDSGATWSRRLSNSGGLGLWARYGLFYRTAAGSLITTYDPYDNSATKIQRSADGGGTWTDVVAAQKHVGYLGPTNICQDPVSGYLYLAEYVTAQSTLLPSPTPGAPTTATTGGTLAAATYYYVLTATNANGETLKSAEVSITTTGTTSTVTIPWTAVAGATGYKVYRGTAAGAHSLLATVGNVATYTDTGAATTAPTPPTTNTTGLTTWKIARSTDDGVTWAAFHTFQRDSAVYPTTAVRHGHGIQWDPISQRIYFLCGDSEQAAGIYRVNADGTAIEPVITRAQLPADIWAGAVGVMFFPNYIAWGIDQSSDSHLIRMARTEIGKPVPAVEKMGRLQSTAFYCIRTKSDNTEWLMSVSNENGGGGRIDNAVHFYRVADDAATLDEVHAESVASGAAFFWGQPVGDPLKTITNGLFWVASSVKSITDKNVGMGGWQAPARLVWGERSFVKPEPKVFYTPTSQSSGVMTLTMNTSKVFAALQAPLRAKRLFIIDAGVHKISGTGLPFFELWNANTGALVKDARTAVTIQDQARSARTRLNEESAPYVFVTDPLSPDTVLHLRIIEANVGDCEASAYFTYAWGI